MRASQHLRPAAKPAVAVPSGRWTALTRPGWVAEPYFRLTQASDARWNVAMTAAMRAVDYSTLIETMRVSYRGDQSITGYLKFHCKYNLIEIKSTGQHTADMSYGKYSTSEQ